MKKLFTALFIVLSISVFANEYQSPMSLYKDNYFVAGNKDNQVKFQFSAKYNLLYPSQTGLNVGYTQVSWWTCYNGRDSFSSNYQPEFFYILESKNNVFNNFDMKAIDYIQISPIYHSSTGDEGIKHRGLNAYYIQGQISGGTVFNFGVNVKYFRYYNLNSRNKDFNDYRKNYEADFFFKIKSATNFYIDKFELHAKFTGNPRDKGYYIIEGICQLFTSKLQPKFFIQYNNGYGVNMVTYNVKQKEIRAGLIF